MRIHCGVELPGEVGGTLGGARGARIDQGGGKGPPHDYGRRSSEGRGRQRRPGRTPGDRGGCCEGRRPKSGSAPGTMGCGWRLPALMRAGTGRAMPPPERSSAACSCDSQAEVTHASRPTHRLGGGRGANSYFLGMPWCPRPPSSGATRRQSGSHPCAPAPFTDPSTANTARRSGRTRGFGHPGGRDA